MWPELGLVDEDAAHHPPPLVHERVASAVTSSADLVRAVADRIRGASDFDEVRTLLTAFRQAEVLPDLLELPVERAPPPPDVNLDLALADLPAGADAFVKLCLISKAVPGRPRDVAQSAGDGRRHRDRNRPDALHVEMKVARIGDPSRRKRPGYSGTCK
jgi:hypothetical protein